MLTENNYRELFKVVNEGIACVVFLKKKKNEVRCMLCTRNNILSNEFIGYLGTKLNMFDGKYAQSNDILPVIDLAIQDVRSVTTSRMIYLQELPTPSSIEDFENLLSCFKAFETQCIELLGHAISDSLDALDENYMIQHYEQLMRSLTMQVPLKPKKHNNQLSILLTQKLKATTDLLLYDI